MKPKTAKSRQAVRYNNYPCRLLRSRRHFVALTQSQASFRPAGAIEKRASTSTRNREHHERGRRSNVSAHRAASRATTGPSCNARDKTSREPCPFDHGDEPGAWRRSCQCQHAEARCARPSQCRRLAAREEGENRRVVCESHWRMPPPVRQLPHTSASLRRKAAMRRLLQGEDGVHLQDVSALSLACPALSAS